MMFYPLLANCRWTQLFTGYLCATWVCKDVPPLIVGHHDEPRCSLVPCILGSLISMRLSYLCEAESPLMGTPFCLTWLVTGFLHAGWGYPGMACLPLMSPCHSCSTQVAKAVLWLLVSWFLLLLRGFALHGKSPPKHHWGLSMTGRPYCSLVSYLHDWVLANRCQLSIYEFYGMENLTVESSQFMGQSGFPCCCIILVSRINKQLRITFQMPP